MQNNFDDIIDKLDKGELWDFPGGVFPAERKTLSNQTPIAKLPIPERLYVTVKQHIGVEGHLIVEVGQKVLKGQALTKSMNPFAVPVHASTSGEITAIHKHVSAHPSGLPELTVQITSDQDDKWTQLSPMVDYQNQPKTKVLAAICDAGISGMGGAGFPTHIKSSPKKDVDFLIINGIECEPYITSDDRLMREHSWQIRQGIDVLCHLLKPKHVLIGIENNKPEAIEAMQVACRENPNYRVCTIPTKYPAGGEKQLIQVLTNREVPAQGLPVDVGVIMHNVGTCFAIADAIFAGKPLISRVVTVTGEAVEKPSNVWALIGSPIAHLLTHCEYKQTLQKQSNIIMGGPMMGFNVSSDLVPVVKTTNCILAPTDNEMASNNEQACIRCSACADACPASLLPQQLFWHAKAKELDKAQDYNLFDCIECGACAYVCPSEIPLVHYYRIAKAEIRVEQEDKQKSDKARDRFEKREARLIAEQQARDEKHRLAAEARKQAMASNGNNSKDKIAAALARAKAKKQALSEVDDKAIEATELAPANTSEQTAKAEVAEPATKVASSNQRVQAAIARAKAKKAAAEVTDINTELKDKDDASNLKDEQLKQPQQHIDVKKQPNKVSMSTKTVVTDSIPKAVETPPTEKPTITDSKQAKIAAAVAKAKAKREAQKAANSQVAAEPVSAAKVDNIKTVSADELVKTEEQQIDMKKRRIAAAVAKAKAKKAAEKADKSS
ncbi:electron transport complex subunit RsxC [Paraglaciecola arctica]|uniref:Ion-translocating oxidoreductase complex subunit C n=1 Tax=Paraglaciecola arctica BSs20135 TaxID=493475 RepID=K6Y3C4_9ALTE|nr:electron transport complex subunit RsxC [Paraglaciecola arctica]GAC18451.1 electron transport complex protein RnfC [Paraglaciecola arctica BSs20135]